jgi:ubiquinone/menaquinone biosynthesis C-methylase UbiE
MTSDDPAQSFDRVAEAYEATRSTYPEEILDLLPLTTEATVLDLGAGTGKLTRILVPRYAHVIAVEPLDGMRAVLERVVPDAESHAGTAEEIPLADASVDGVFAGQAFHWFRNEQAIAEIARVLRPGGVVCAVWNSGEDGSNIPQAYNDYLEPLQAPSLERVRSGPTLEELLGRGPFGPVRQAAVRYELTRDRDAQLGLASSVSWIASRPDDERARIMSDLDALLPEGPFTMPMVSELFWAVRA